jgi:cell filamentation protein
MIASVSDGTKIMVLLRQALTNKINDREMFMKGIDYSYYYEEEGIVDSSEVTVTIPG